MSAEYPDELRPDVANLGEPLLPSRGNSPSIHRGVSVAFSGSSSRRFNSSAWRLSDPALSWAARCLLPDSGCLRAWALLTTALAYFTAVEGPFAIAFRHRLTPVQLATDAVFCADTVLQFFKPRVQGGTYVTQPACVAWSYLTTGFLLDALAALPWDRIAGATYGSSETAMACGLLRLLRLRRCFALMADMERNINLNYHTAVLFRLLSILLIIAHWEACGFWYLAYAHKFDDTTWTFHFGEYRPGQTIWDHYLSALYWTFTTMSTTGYGDLVPVNDDERVYTLCIMVLNIGLTAYIVGNMTVLATKDDSSSLEYRGVMSQLKAYMQHKGIGEDLKAMAVQHLKLKREMQVERDDVLDHCAPYIRNRILASLYKSRLASCALFQGASESFVDAISQAAYMEFVFPDSWLLNAGERSSHLYCIISGTVEVLNKDGLRLWGICEGATIGDETALCDFPMAYSYHSVTLVKTLVVPVTVLRQACNQNKLSHRMACFNMQSCLRSIDSVLEPDVAERIRQVSSYITARRTDLVTKLCYAASTNDLAYMKQLLNSDPEHDINLGDYDGRRPIHIAAAYGRIAILKHLINDLNADVNSKDAMGGTPLLDAVKQGHRKAAEFLREVGAELGLEDSASVLCNAVFREKADLLQLYLDFGADPNGGDYDLRTPLHIACAEGLLPMVKILVAHGANLHARDRWMETPLQEAEKSPSQLTVASYLAEVLQQQQWQLQGEARGRDALVMQREKHPTETTAQALSLVSCCYEPCTVWRQGLAAAHDRQPP